MKVIDEIVSACRINQVFLENIAVTYAPREGLCLWWIRSSTYNGLKAADFVQQTLELSNDAWWVRQVYDDMDWSAYYLTETDDVDLGPYSFNLLYKDFLRLYSRQYEATQNPNLVGVNYDKIKRGDNVKNKPVRTNWVGGPPFPVVASSEPEKAAEPEFPITYMCDGKEFSNLVEVDKHVRRAKLTKLLFGDCGIPQEAQTEFVNAMIREQAEVIKLLKGL